MIDRKEVRKAILGATTRTKSGSIEVDFMKLLQNPECRKEFEEFLDKSGVNEKYKILGHEVLDDKSKN